MAVAAKIKCNVKNVCGEADDRRVVVGFAPDYQDNRNQEWALATPHLHLEMTLRGDVSDQFEVGEPYTLTFTPED